MPSLARLALYYVIGLIVLRLAYIAAVNLLGVPNTLATTVILAAAPAIFIGNEAVKLATRALALRDWATIWGVLMSIYLILNIMIPAMLVPGFRDVLSDPVGLRSLLVVAAATGAMLVLFLWLGARSRGHARRG